MSNSQNAIELSKHVLSLSEKVAFMLITASTASIAYILAEVKDGKWNELIYFPIYALCLLALSFVFGYSHLVKKIDATNQNSLLLQLTNWKNSTNEKNELLDKMETSLKKAGIFSRLQFITFIAGIITYAIFIFLSIFLNK
ncbi:hypothetical protein [Acinetobacter baumannii]|uniref:Uncharacterized protein n=1 Tax=Acinetobacter baumannii TaxID=470 RepID=A0AAP1W6T0_ACIBA|nr:hypothetical protein [Acinetobacter baumannii]MBD2849458.1 hypothetical protein [Acinetobacter baumannii]MBD3133615.1 hypothetical protein [Acinetobacter baumannii]MBE0306821.1 hypothetical protein [Acinetobacter baumannii]MBE0312498.1 hypothetical protein [Acinetobacter baumannii]MBE0330005.1 hypothetical protein [Acinetobacter baumannii]